MIRTLFFCFIILERLAELVVSRRNAIWSLRNGGKEYGANHYPWMVILHVSLLLGILAEWGYSTTTPSDSIGFILLFLLILLQCVRWWVIVTLGHQWNTRVIVIPGLPLVTGGPFKYFKHPNYIVVIAEGFLLPMFYGAIITAFLFSVLNGFLLYHRISVENLALKELGEGDAR